MWSEEDLRAGHLLHLWRVTMIEQAVRGEVLVHAREHRRLLQCPSCTRNSRGGIDDDTRWLDDPALHEWREGKTRRGDVTAWCGDERRACEGRPIHLREAVHGLLDQRWLCVLKAVPPWIQRRVLETKRCRQIDDQPNLADQLRSNLECSFMRKAQEDDVTTKS
ncbi:MAG: hypothetical protein RIT23_682 [Actinomycetota bacterium]